MQIKRFSRKQGEILKFIGQDCPYLICDGAVRSGKTVVMALAFVLWAMTYFDRCNFAICAKTVQSAERNILRPFQALEGLPYSMSYKLSSRMLTVKCGPVENYFYLFGGKDESSYMLIQGITLAGVLLDEVALMPRSFVEQALARTLTYTNAKIWFNCNPEGPQHWFYQEWIQKAGEKDAKHLHFLMEDNPILTEKEIEKAAKMFSGVFYDRYILGRWVLAEGLIYRVFAEDEARYGIRRGDVPPLRYINIGVDFGGNKSNHAFVATGIDAQFKNVYVLKSWSLKAADTSVDYIVSKFAEFAKSIEEAYGFVDMVFADSAEQAIINTMRSRTGYNIRNSLKNQIIDRIRCEDILLGGERLKLVEGENEALANGLRGAVWDAKHDGQRLDDGTSDIDVLDAFEYSWEYYKTRLIRSKA